MLGSKVKAGELMGADQFKKFCIVGWTMQGDTITIQGVDRDSTTAGAADKLNKTMRMQGGQYSREGKR